MLAERTNGGWRMVWAGGIAGLAWLIHKDYRMTPFDTFFAQAAATYGLDPPLLKALALVESSMNPDAISPSNPDGSRDYGLMQINDRTAQHYGVPVTRLMDPKVSIDTAGRLLSDLKDELSDKLNDYSLISAYNVGSPTVLRRGIVNWPYVMKVQVDRELFALGKLFV